MAAKIQDADVKGTADVTSDSRLIGFNKIWIAGLSKRGDQAITDGDFGGASGLVNFATVSGASTLTTTQFVVAVTTAGTQTLPTAVSVTGKQYAILNKSTGNVAINTTSSQTIDGRASGAITLAPTDFIVVISDGSNWRIVSKKQTEYITATSSNYSLPGSVTVQASYLNMTGNSVTLTAGTWRVFGRFMLSSGNGGVSVGIGTNSEQTGFYAANGTLNSITAPTSITTVGTVYGDSHMAPREQSTNGEHAYATNVSGVRMVSASTLAGPFTITVTSSQTIYLVPAIRWSTLGGSVNAYISAERIW